MMTWIAAFIFIAALIVLGAWFLRGYLGGSSAGGLFGTGALFGAKPDKRLDVVEHTTIDGRRRLVLIRRDEVEHLIMTGGPVDVVIETNIGAAKTPERGRFTALEGASDRVVVGRSQLRSAQSAAES
jgi:hypothetical protein